MVPFQARGQSPQDLQALFHGGGSHLHGAKAPGQGRVRLHPAAVFLPGGSPDDLDAAPAQGRLQQIGPVDGALGSPGSHQGVELV